MKFITEDDLRMIYRKNPFAVYEVKPGTRLTPGGRQFLNDRGIRIGSPVNGKAGQADAVAGSPAAGPASHLPAAAGRPFTHIAAHPSAEAAGTSESCPLPAAPAIRTLQAEFLLAGSALLERDVLMAQELFELEQCLGRLANGEPEEGPQCRNCTGITQDNWNVCQKDCFQVTGFHAQSSKGPEIVRLHLLRCRLRELKAQFGDENKEPVNRIINRLSQMICLAFGGNTCQKKN